MRRNNIKTILYKVADRPQDHGIDVPPWIDQDIDANDIAAILDSIDGGHRLGCGSYMPAVTYHEAMETLTQHEDEIFSFLEERGMLPQLGESYVALAVEIMVEAVMAWAEEVAEPLARSIDGEDNESFTPRGAAAS